MQDTIAVIGCYGFNVTKRILPELRKLNPRWIIGYDLVEAPGELGFPYIRVKDDAELARRLKEQRPKTVLMDSGARLVICEKPVALSQTEATGVVRLCKAARPNQQVNIQDHYRNLEFIRLLWANARRWLGSARSLEMVLLESQGVPLNQVRSHAQGMFNFLHHVPAIAGLFIDLHSLRVREAVKARHPAAPVPDSFRGAVFSAMGQCPVSIRGCVGKFIEKSSRRIMVSGTGGTVTIDRSTHKLHVACTDGVNSLRY